MADIITYSSEFPSGKESDFTAEEITAREEKAIRSEAGVKANLDHVAKRVIDRASGNQKLKDLGLTDDEISALVGDVEEVAEEEESEE